MQISPAIPVSPNPFEVIEDDYTLYCPPEEVSIPGMNPNWKLYRLGDGGASPVVRRYDYFGEYASGVIKAMAFTDLASYASCASYLRGSMMRAQSDTRRVNSIYGDPDSLRHTFDYDVRVVNDYNRQSPPSPGVRAECAQTIDLWLIPTFPTTYDIRFNDILLNGEADVSVRDEPLGTLFSRRLRGTHLGALADGVGRKEGLLLKERVAETLAQTVVTKLLRWPMTGGIAGPVANAVVWRKDLGTQDYIVLDLIVAQPTNGDNPSLCPAPGTGVGIFDQRNASGIHINSASQIRAGGTSLHALRVRVALADSNMDTLDIWKLGYRGVVFDLLKPSLDTLGIDVRTEGVYLNLKEGLCTYLGPDLYSAMGKLGCNFFNVAASSGSSSIMSKSTGQKTAADLAHLIANNCVFSREELFLDPVASSLTLMETNPFDRETRDFIEETAILRRTVCGIHPSSRKAAFIKIVSSYPPLKGLLQEMALMAERGAEEDLLSRKLTAPVWDTFKEKVRRDPALKRRILSASQESVKSIVAKLVESGP